MSEREIARTEFMAGLRKRGIKDPRVLSAMDKVPRDQFVESSEQESAFSDRALPIPCGQTISQPSLVAAMTEALRVSSEHRVLEIGTGSGYQAAILAHLAKHVFSIERFSRLAKIADARIKKLGIENVTVIEGDGTEGLQAEAPFDRIMVTAAAPEIPPVLIGQLVGGGVLIAPVGFRNEIQQLRRITKTPSGATQAEDLMAVRFVPLLQGKGPSA